MQNKFSFIPDFLEPLTPSDNAEQAGAYSKSLKWAIDKREIKNVALTGPYGSGKSSILKTFMNSHKKTYNFLEISLATFADIEEEELDNEKKAENFRLIELGILKQIFYKVNQDDIPYTRFKRIKEISSLQLFEYSFYIVLGMLGSILLFKEEFFSKLSFWDALYKEHTNGFFFLSLVCISPFSFLLIAFAIKAIGNSRLNKFKFSDTEIVFNADGETSILNRHIDELLYFFKKTKYEVVMIEDLDRFKNQEIFTKLREINTLINNYEQVKQKVTFIYAVKDDMFTDALRTKFFDFIIPVIPVVNTSNSFEKAIKKNNESKSKISEQLIGDVTLYLNDMRVLKNIFNEYYIYSDTLREEIRNDKLFAMVVYKNMHPDDFADLHVNEGVIYRAFNTLKRSMADKAISDKRSRITLLENQIAIIENEKIETVSNLVTFYIGAISQKMPEALALRIDGHRRNLGKITIEDLRWLNEQNDIHYYYDMYGNTMRYNGSFKSIQSTLSSQTLTEREENIVSGINGSLEKIKLQVGNLSAEIEEIKSYSLSELFDVDPDLEQLIEPNLQEKKLLLHLIREGYIDETYVETVSYFYEGSMSITDKDFLLSVKDRASRDMNMKLVSIPKILQRLTRPEFSREAILNYSLLEYLCENSIQYDLNLRDVILLLSNKSKRAKEFLDGYNLIGKNSGIFAEYLCQFWPDVWKYVHEESNYPISKKNAWLRAIIVNCKISYGLMNSNAVLSEYITNLPSFLGLFTNHIEVAQAQKAISELAIKFRNIDSRDSSHVLFDFVCENYFYEINVEMVKLIIEKKGDGNAVKYIDTANYTAIKISKYNPLIANIENNIEHYIGSTFLRISSNIEENEDSLISILANTQISLQNKERVIAKEIVKILDVSVVNANAWEALFRFNKVEPSWQNVIAYYSHANGVDDILVGYLNIPPNYEVLSLNDMNNLNEVGNVASFCEEFVSGATTISDKAFETLIRVFPVKFSEGVQFDEISGTKVDSLIKYNILNLTEYNFSLLKKHFGERHITLVENKMDDFLTKGQTQFELDQSDWSALLKSSRVSESHKVNLVQLLDSRGVEPQNMLAQSIVRVMKKENGTKISSRILSIILRSLNSVEQKLELLILQTRFLTGADTFKMLEDVGDNYAEIKPTGRQLRFDDTDLHRRLLTEFEERQIISSVSEDGGRLKVNLKRGQV